MTTPVEPPKQRRDVVVHAEGPSGGAVGLQVAEAIVPAHLLDGGEVVHLALKPSPWFVVLVSLRWIGFGAVLLVLASQPWVPSSAVFYIWNLGLFCIGGRLALAMLEWVSRLYVLTNRRVMRLRGVLNVELFECPLTRIQNTYLSLSVPERMTRVGTITIQTAAAGGSGGSAAWRYVGRPLDVHEKLREAIAKSRSRGSYGA